MSEYAVVREGGAGLIDLSSRGRMRVSGAEATMFLNGLITNDMKTLGENRWMPAVFPNVQGRLLAAVRVVRGNKDSGFLIDTEAATHETVLKTISRFRLAGDFRVNDVTAETALLTIQGKRAVEVVEKVFEIAVSDLPRDGVVEIEWRNDPTTLFRATHTAEDGFDVMIDSANAAELQRSLEEAGARAVSQNTFEILRVEAGIARYGTDMDETNVVTETNLDDAVSYTKGCYIGQEIIVRIKHRGHVAKKLTGLQFETEQEIEAGTLLKSDGKEIGRVTSSVYSPALGRTIGLGYVRYEFLAAGTTVSIDENIAAVITELPFIRGSWYQNHD